MESSPSLKFRDSLDQVTQLLAIHLMLTGKGPGRRHKVDVLNKAAILFLCAAFEAFVEDLAERTFTFFILKSADPAKLPLRLRKGIAQALREDKNELRVWDLAGDGWRTAAEHFKSHVSSKFVGPFNTPKPGNIEGLFRDLVGLEDFCSHWKWHMTSVDTAKDKLKKFVELRGALAHGQIPAPAVGKADVLKYYKFLGQLSVRMSNQVRIYAHTSTGEYPWKAAHFGSVT